MTNSPETRRPVRTRFAPSPTGYLHVGGARTALYNFLYAKHFGGEFILRVEDTDLERSTEESMRMQVADLKWLGIDWDEGPDLSGTSYAERGDCGPYRQSLRTQIYLDRAMSLVDRGIAYFDDRTDTELTQIRDRLLAEGRPPHIPKPEKGLSKEEGLRLRQEGRPVAIRFHVKAAQSDYLLKDLVRGEVRFPADMVGDFVLVRSNGMPVYNFCCVIDDALMRITHVFRAEEHLSNTVRQLMIYEALGFEAPEFGHLSFILGADKQKLSKRHGASSCNDFRLKGFLPEALNNFILLSGWSSPDGREILTRQEQIELFTHERFNSAPAVFDETKLTWMNSQYLRELSNEELWMRIEPFLNEAGIRSPLFLVAAWRNEALSAFKTSMQTLKDAVQLFTPIDDSRFLIHESAKECLAWPETRSVWLAWKKSLESLQSERLSVEEFQLLETAVKNEAGVKGKHLFQPIRVAVIGQPQGTEMKVLVPLLSRKSLIQRVEICLQSIGQVQ